MSVFDSKSNWLSGESQDLFARTITPFTPRGTSADNAFKNVPANATRTNVMSSTSGGNTVLPIINNNYSTYKKITNIVSLYEFYSLTEKILELIKDYINRTIDPEASVLRCIRQDDDMMTNVGRLNNLFDKLKFKEIIKSEMDRINYYGSTAFAISFTKKFDENGNNYNDYKLTKLKCPHNVIMVINGNTRFYLIDKGITASSGTANPKNISNSINTANGLSNTELLTDDKILYLGSLDMELKHDDESKKILDRHLKLSNSKSSASKFNVDAYKDAAIKSHIQSSDPVISATELNSVPTKMPSSAFNTSDPIQLSIYEDIVAYKYDIRASKPLYYSIHQMVKDYFIKDIILYVLGVKSAVQPLVLTWGVDQSYNYTTDELMDLITSIESRMNKMVDIDLINSANMDMDILVNRILGNIRVIPDLGNNIRALDEKELDSLSRRIQELTQSKMQLKDEILDSVGIPKDLFEGATNREEVLKRDERFQSLILKFIVKLKDAIKSAAMTFAKLEGIQINPDDFEVALFRKSSIEYTLNTAKLESVREFTSMLLTTLSDIQQLSQTGMVDRDRLYGLIKKQFTMVGDDTASVLLDQLPQQQDENQ